MFSSTAIALYGYDQGMMSLINTNKDYLSVMGLEEESPQVGGMFTDLRLSRQGKKASTDNLQSHRRGLLPGLRRWGGIIL
jgi:hypothetical protein